jgi:tripartite-type tricarboxylate transporter receptor subunit TctC
MDELKVAPTEAATPQQSKKRTPMITRRHLVALSAASATAQIPIGRAFAQAASPQAGSPQAWPTRIVKLVVPFTPGGGIDGVARIVGARLSEKWGQQVVVENKPGAGGNIASDMVARSAPDGYTMYITAAGLALNRYLFQSIPYDPVADFAPVTLICLFPNLLVVPNSSPIRSVADLLAEAKKNPGKITFASPGHGSSPHMSGELFKYLAKVDLTHIPYRGASPALTDVLGGRVDVYFSVMASGIPLVRSGQLRALGVTTASRVQSDPDIATIAEAGVPGYDTSSWFAFFVPAKTPADIIKKIHADTVATLAEPPIKAKLDGLGLITVGSTPEELGAHFKSEMEKWEPVIRAANIKVSE